MEERLNKVVMKEEEDMNKKDRVTMQTKQEKKEKAKQKEGKQENNGPNKEGDKMSMKVEVKRKKKVEEEKQKEMEGSKRKKEKKQEVAEQNEDVKDINIYPQFIKTIFPKKPVEKLRIPQAFNKFLENEPLGVVSLKRPSGNTWYAKLVLDSEGFCITHGWNNFFIDRNTNLGEILVFHYNGESTFSITIFDLTSCERQSAFLACPSNDATKNYEKGLMGIDVAKTSHCPHEDYKGHNTMSGGMQEDVGHVSNYVENTLEYMDKGESMDVRDILQHGERKNMDIDTYDASNTSFFPSGVEKTRKLLDILKDFSGSSQRANDRLSGASFDSRRKDSNGTTSQKSNRALSCDKFMRDVPRKGSLRMNAEKVNPFQNSARI